MTGEMIAFFILALTAIAGGVMMINMTNVIHMVVALVFTFLAIAGIYITLSAEFVAAVQVLIYSGAITIIMLFGIMLTRHEGMTEWKLPKLTVLLSGAGIIVFFVIMFFGINRLSLGNPATNLHVDNTKNIGIELYSKYVIPFELTSVLLLVALIGAIVIAKRDDEKEAGK